MNRSSSLRVMLFLVVAALISNSCTEKDRSEKSINSFGKVVQATFRQDGNTRYIENEIKLLKLVGRNEVDTGESVLVCTGKSLRVGERVIVLLNEVSRKKGECGGYNVSTSHGNRNLVIESFLLPRGLYFYNTPYGLFENYDCPRNALVLLGDLEPPGFRPEIERELIYVTQRDDAYMPENVLINCLGIGLGKNHERR